MTGDKDINDLKLCNPSDTALRGAREPLHVLVIDDDPTAGLIIRNIFSSMYPVRICTGLQEGLNEYMRFMPDLLFLDVNLGNKDFNGLDILRIVSECDKESNVVVMSADASKENITGSLYGGARGFLKKPFNMKRLIEYAWECEHRKSRGKAGVWN